MQINFTLTGRIEDSQYDNRNGNTVYRTLITAPAPDAYSQPSSYKLVSDTSLGGNGSEITVDVTMTGFIRKKDYRDKETNQPKTFWEDNYTLRARLAQPKSQAKAS